MSFGTILWIVTLGVFVFECIYGIILAYHWLRFADTKTSIITLTLYGSCALILTAMLAALAAAMTL